MQNLSLHLKLFRKAEIEQSAASLDSRTTLASHQQHFGRGIELPTWDESGEPSVDVAETDNDVQVTAELPGVDEKDIDVTLADRALTIKAEKRAEKKEEGKQYHMVERSYGSFTRNVLLPCDVDQEAADAKFDKGVLSIILPKSAEARRKTKTIKIES